MSRNSSNYPFFFSGNEPEIEDCGKGATHLTARHCQLEIMVDRIGAEWAQKDMIREMWANFEENYATLLSGFDSLDNGEMARFAEKYLKKTMTLPEATRNEVLTEFLYALENSKHVPLYADAQFAEAICKTSLEISIPFLERNIKKWTRQLYTAIICEMEGPEDVLLFSKEFRKKKKTNTFFLSIIQSYLCDGCEWRSVKEVIFS